MQAMSIYYLIRKSYLEIRKLLCKEYLVSYLDLPFLLRQWRPVCPAHGVN